MPLSTAPKVLVDEVELPPINRCASCEAPIALYPPTPAEPASAWACDRCGAVYFGRVLGGATVNETGLVQIASTGSCKFAYQAYSEAEAEPSVPPENVQRLIRVLAKDNYRGNERRRNKHYSVVVPVIAVPLAADFSVAGKSLQMTTANVSLSGAALLHTRFTETPYFALDFTAAGIELVQVVMEVLRVRPVGPLYEIGGRFLSRLK